MSPTGSACTPLTTYDTYVNDTPRNSNQPELPRDVQYEVSYSSAYLNNLIQPASNPHRGILPATSRSYMHPTYLEGTNVHTDLSILGSETHNDSRVIEEIRSSSGAEARSNDTALLGGLILKQDAVDSDATSLKQSGKKSRTESRASGDEAASKKIRGRPRVDTADDTAADRRRTQIRLAQRAYRLRKETTISSLKEKVSELHSAIEDVNKSFLKFNNTAMSSGIIEMRSDLGRDLKETTEQFLMLTRIANLDQESGIDEEMEESGRRSGESAAEGKSKTPTRRGTAKRSKGIPPAPEKSKPDPWGYQIVHEEYPLNKNGKRPSKLSPMSEPQHDGFRRGWEGTDASRSPRSTTPEAGFGPIQPPQQFPAGVPSLDRYTYGFDLQQAAPSIPWTFSFQETTFARRLHRAAVERGYYLLLSPNSPPSDVTRAFEFCFTFSDRDETLRRLRGILMRSTKESLEYPEAPILHIGGSGLHYPRKNVPRNPETMADLMAPVRSIGPMALAIAEGAKEKCMTPETMINLMGLDGEWFDPNDVEGYLREKGVVFSGGSSFAEIELESPHALDTTSTATPLSPVFSVSNSNSHSSPSEQSRSYNNGNGGQGFNFSNDILFVEAAATNPFTTSMIPGNDSYFNPNLEKPLRHDMYTSADNTYPFDFNAHVQAGASVTSIPHILNANEVTNFGKRHSKGKRTVSLDIPVLVEELINRGKCLGRSPGFRKGDVDEAIRTAIIPTY